MDQDCYIKIGDEYHHGLEAAKLLAGIRERQRVEICFQGCSEVDKQLIIAIHDKWRQDSSPWRKYRLLVYAGLAVLLLVLAHAGGYLEQAKQLLLPSSTSEAAGGDSLFADKASMHAFMGTIAVILGVVVVFVRRLGRQAAQGQASGMRLKDTELSRLLAKGYALGLDQGKLTLNPRSR